MRLAVSNLIRVAKRHVRFLGPGLVSSVAYIDPGNWATDLSAGAHYGYKLLFIVLLAGLAAAVLQTLAVRLGATTLSSLAHQTRRIILEMEDRHPKYRIVLHGLLWSLYALAEVAIIATDLAELLGTAIALNLLFPRLPLFAGVLITAADSLLIIVFFRSDHGRRGMVFFEVVIVTLVLCVFVCFMVLLHLINPVWKDVFLGLVPSKTLVKPNALYLGVGIIGATVMPHALFLGSSLAGIDRLGTMPRPPPPPPTNPLIAKTSFVHRRFRGRRKQTVVREENDLVEMKSIGSHRGGMQRELLEAGTEAVTRASLPAGQASLGSADHAAALKRYEAELRTFDRIQWTDLHIRHATADTIFSLLGFALTINAAILTLAGAAFYYQNSDLDPDSADLFGAHALIKDYIGNAAAIIFALALLCAGQSASITCTLAGQVVSEGFINWRVSPLIRRVVTRCIGVVPAAIVAAALGERGLNTMLVASQVILSVVLPTVMIPLVYLCSRKDIMTVDGPAEEPTRLGDHLQSGSTSPSSLRKKVYVSAKWVTALGYVLALVVIVANVYVFVQLGRGK